MTGPVLVQQHGDARWLRLNRPEQRNALGPELVDALDAAVGDAMDDEATRFILISGEGASFCAGADLRHLRAVANNGNDPMPYLASISACFDRIEQATKPVVALIHGHAVAGGLELALVCDVVVAVSGTLIGDGHARNGLLPAAGSSVRLPKKVGEPLARWLILTGQLLPAEAFLPSGFVHAVVESHEAEAVIDTLLAELRAPIASTQMLGKILLQQSGQLATDAEAFGGERTLFARNWANGHIRSTLHRFAESELGSR